jgi:hypothetical protein
MASILQQSNMADITHWEIGQLVYSFYAMGPAQTVVRRAVDTFYQKLLQRLRSGSAPVQPERGRFGEPQLQWVEPSFQGPNPERSWCGTYHLIWKSDALHQGTGCLWAISPFKSFARWLEQQVTSVLRETVSQGASVYIDDKPFFWTLAIDSQPKVRWTSEELHRHRGSVTALVRARSEDWSIYHDRAMQQILDTNMAYTTEELQLMHYNTGLIYISKERFLKREGFDYVQRAIVDTNALLRTMRVCLLLLRSELDRTLQTSINARVANRYRHASLRNMLVRAQSATDLLGQFNRQNFDATRRVGHEQTVFFTLLNRYQIPTLVDSVNQQLGRLHDQIGEYHNARQSRQLRLVNVLVLIPALYHAWKFYIEVVPTLAPFWQTLMKNMPTWNLPW